MITHQDTHAKLATGLLLIAASWFISFSAAANTCLAHLTSNAVKAGELKVCQSAYNGIADEYSCQDYQSGDTRYRVLYKGGLVPKAIVRLDSELRERVVWSTIFAHKRITCSLSPPDGVPAKANHRGTGLCLDENDRTVPCSIYEHAEPRKTEYHRYLAYYNPAGTGTINIDVFVAGDNKDALVAEFAYQIGLSLLDTRCCSDEAIAYLEYAHHLFPKADLYRAAYDNAKTLFAAKAAGNDLDI